MATETPTGAGTPPGDTAPDIWTFSPEQASKQLQEMKAAFDGAPPTDKPTTPSEARLRLATLGRDFLNRLEQGDVATREEFDALTTMAADDKDPIAALLAGEPAPNEMRIGPGYATLRQIAEAIPALREDGLTDGQIHQLASDHVFKPEEVAAVQRLQNELHGTAAWVQKLLSGDAEAKREQLLMSCVLLQKRVA